MSNEMKDKKVEELSGLLDNDFSTDEDIAKLPVPDGVTREQEENVKSKIDEKIYSYGELVGRLDKQDKSPLIPTFFEPIDELVGTEKKEDGTINTRGGFKGGELIVWSGPTKNGKTTMLQTVSYLQSKQGFPSLWFSLEMSWQELTEKFREMDKEGKINNKTTDLPIYYMVDNRGLDMDWLDKKIETAKREHGIASVFIDHLHFLLPLKDFNTNTSFLIGGIVREIKKMAVRHNIPIFLVCHTKKIDVNTNPDINSIRDASFIAQESDFSFIIWRVRKNTNKKQGQQDEVEALMDVGDDVYTNLTVLSLEANRRNGKTKRILMGYYNGLFYPANEYYNIISFDNKSNPWELQRLEAYRQRMMNSN